MGPFKLSSLRTTVVLCVVLTFLFIGVGAALYFSELIDERFLEVEQTGLKSDLQQGSQVLRRVSDGLRKTASDWAWWNDTYEFADDHNERYINTNLLLQVLANVNVDAIYYLNLKGEVIVSRAFDPNGAPVEPPSALTGMITTHPDLTKFTRIEEYRSGLVHVPDAGTYLLAAVPIATSARRGPARGVLIMLRRFNRAVVNELRAVTGREFSYVPAVPLAAPPVEEILVDPLNENRVRASMIVKDIDGRAIGLLSMERDRPIFSISLDAKRKARWTVDLGAVAFCLVMLLLMQWRVISRVERFERDLQAIALSNDLSRRIQPDGNDEITRLARVTNSLLDAVESAYLRAEEGRARLYSQTQDLIRLTEQLREAHRDAAHSTRLKEQLLENLQRDVASPLAEMEQLLRDVIEIRQSERWEDAERVHRKADELSERVKDALRLTDLRSSAFGGNKDSRIE